MKIKSGLARTVNVLKARYIAQKKMQSYRGKRESKAIKEVASRGNPVETNVLIQKTRGTLEWKQSGARVNIPG